MIEAVLGQPSTSTGSQQEMLTQNLNYNNLDTYMISYRSKVQGMAQKNTKIKQHILVHECTLHSNHKYVQ